MGAESEATRVDDDLLQALIGALLEEHGLTHVRLYKRSQMQLAEARATDGKHVTFWVRKAWNFSDIAAVPFTMVKGPPPAADEQYVASVRRLAANAKARGAQYILMVHLVDGLIQPNYAVLNLDDVVLAYEEQLARWPAKAKEGAQPALYFDDKRPLAIVERTAALRRLSVSLDAIAGLAPMEKGAGPDSKTVWGATVRRMKQQVFRELVGQASGWTCAVSGNQVRRVLEAAHLPGKDWQFHNRADDGVMLRVDLHRLLDAGLAELRDGQFLIHEAARCEQYAQFHGRAYAGGLPPTAGTSAT